MSAFNEEKYDIVMKKLDSFNSIIKNDLSLQDKLKNVLNAFKDFLSNFYHDNELLHEVAIDDDYYIETGNKIIDEFSVIEFSHFENFLHKFHNEFDSIVAECIALQSLNCRRINVPV